MFGAFTDIIYGWSVNFVAVKIIYKIFIVTLL